MIFWLQFTANRQVWAVFGFGLSGQRDVSSVFAMPSSLPVLMEPKLGISLTFIKQYKVL